MPVDKFLMGLRGLSVHSRWANEARNAPTDIEDVVGDDPDAQMAWLLAT